MRLRQKPHFCECKALLRDASVLGTLVKHIWSKLHNSAPCGSVGLPTSLLAVLGDAPVHTRRHEVKQHAAARLCDAQSVDVLCPGLSVMGCRLHENARHERRLASGTRGLLCYITLAQFGSGFCRTAAACFANALRWCSAVQIELASPSPTER